jgi:surface carbohydrate biosynthesis protein
VPKVESKVCNGQSGVLAVPPNTMSHNFAIASRLPQTIILPVETLNREFDAKLHLALRAAARGWHVIIGGRTAIHSVLPSLPRSIYLAKGIRAGDRRILRLFEQLGHVIVALDEEALIRYSDETLLMMLDEETFNRPRLLYAWGKSNADVWRRFKGYRGTPILDAGNPRVDLLRPELAGFYGADASGLRARFGRFVLLSSNFSLVNHFIKDHVRFRTAKDSDVKRGNELKTGLVAHKAQLFDAFRAMVPGLARAIAPASLVIRPHPSENPETWQAAAGGLGNVHVIHEGPIAPWIMAADALVHNGCTSAVEAAIAGTPAFAFKPHVSAQFDIELPDRLSRQYFADGELFAAVAQCLGGRAKPTVSLDADQQALLRHHIASLDGPLSAERILDALENHPALHLNLPAPRLFSRLGGLAGHYQRRAIRAITTRLSGSPSSAVYTAHKFPGITEDMIAGRIERFRAIIPEMPRMNLRRIAANIFMIERTGSSDAR